MDNINTRLQDAVKRNCSWIENKCRLGEFNRKKAEELFNEVVFQILKSGKSSEAQNIKSIDAWAKKICLNTIAGHQRKQRNERYAERSQPIEEHHEPDSGRRTDDSANMRIVLDFIEGEFNLRDQEIMRLVMTRESYKNIGELVGMTEGSVANRVMVLKKRVNEFLNRGSNE